MPSFVRVFPGATWGPRIIADPLQNVKVAFLTVRTGEPQIELVEPDGDGAPVSRFLRGRGGGLHHVCYEVDDLEHELAAIALRGSCNRETAKASAAFAGRRIAWVITPEKLLIELLEKASTGPPTGD